jgi:HNH endonuclease
MRSHFAYHLTHFFGPFGLESYHTNSNTVHEGDLVYVVSGDNSDDGGKDYFLEGQFKIHRRSLGPFALKSLKGKQENFQYRLSLLPIRMPTAPIPMSSEEWYNKADVHRYFSSGQNFNPVPQVYQKRFDDLLVRLGAPGNGIADDLAEINRRNLPETEREALVNARIGQGRFRSELARLWNKGEVCFLTGIDVPELLTASHIRPWRDSDDFQRLDPCNGLLLVASLDRAFDRHLLSFREERGDFFVEFHPRIVNAMQLSGVRTNALLPTSHMNLSESRRFADYMAEHYRQHLSVVAAFKKAL